MTEEQVIDLIKDEVGKYITKTQSYDQLSALVAIYLQSLLGQGTITDYDYYPAKAPTTGVIIEVSFPCNPTGVHLFGVFGEDPAVSYDRAMGVV